MKRLLDTPAYVINGIAVALGIACIQLLVSALAGGHAAQLALSGAVCVSLADVPNTVARTWQRLSAAAVLVAVATLVATVLKPYPLALGAGIAVVAFFAMLTMAWGPRAGAVSFAPILAMVFALAVPADAGAGGAPNPLAPLLGWTLAGSALYVGWALLAGRMLQRRYRTLVLAQALRAAATLLQARAALLTSPAGGGADGTRASRDWIAGEADLADRLQTARDFVFDQPNSPAAQRQIVSVLLIVELRDVLLASRLDLDLLGSDETARWVLRSVADGLLRVAAVLHTAAAAARRGGVVAGADGLDLGAADALQLQRLFDSAGPAADDHRARLLPAIADRLQKLGADAQRLRALQCGAPATSPLTRAELHRFVSPEGWPLAALQAHRSGASPVLRHAVRAALALGSAYTIALALPWASHPHWLVLSVAVVLRGNLEQTLSRRNARVLGTMAGCVVVVALSRTQSPMLLHLWFLLAVGTAHAFILQRYWVTASAATVMALLQSHMVDPAGGFAIAERVADTLLGAALAWAFSYVLPSWERRSLPAAIGRVLGELSAYAALALVRDPGDAVEQRLARRRAYDALAALAGALQRSSAEPRSVRLPVKDIAAMLDHGQRLMAHISMVKLTLSNRSAALLEGDDAASATQALAEAAAALSACLDLQQAGRDGAAAGHPATAGGLHAVPERPPADNVLPWLLRRLALLRHDGRQIRAAAAGALAVCAQPKDATTVRTTA